MEIQSVILGGVSFPMDDQVSRTPPKKSRQFLITPLIGLLITTLTPLFCSYLSGFLHNSIHLQRINSGRPDLASFNDRDASLTLVSFAWSPGVVAKLVGDARRCHGGKSPETDT